ncbi:MAG TPA: anthranilate synthase component I family protein [Candidatus Nanoarchaeia archaeon]|nr:anthranilate synthase component I family protein [Candidatus Nanoarchaeia archaeon]
MKLQIAEKEIPYQSAFEYYKSITDNGRIPGLLMESRTRNLAYGKQSIVAANLALKVSGKNEDVHVEALNGQGVALLEEFSSGDFPFAESYTQGGGSLEVRLRKDQNKNLSEGGRVRKTSQATFLRQILGKFSTDNRYAGVYGAFAYDFVRNFEDIGHMHDGEPGDDFTLYLPGDIYVFNDINESAVRYGVQIGGSKEPFHINDVKPDEGGGFRASMGREEYMEKAAVIVDYVRNGKFMQCVLSRSVSFPLIEHPIEGYATLRESNPSPYCFFFSFGDEFLYGSSPEIHAVVENRKLRVRPLAGTVRRFENPLEDALERIRLQTDSKELSEHTMLVDLARNEAYRLCTHDTVVVTDMYTVEEYPNLYHLASGVEGDLRQGMDCLDVLVTTIPAGTLSGAPKLEAMRVIEELEPERRQYYGGAVGYVTFNGELNTGIAIRFVHAKDGYSRVQGGAGIVADSIPEKEFQETCTKMMMPSRAQGYPIDVIRKVLEK